MGHSDARLRLHRPHQLRHRGVGHDGVAVEEQEPRPPRGAHRLVVGPGEAHVLRVADEPRPRELPRDHLGAPVGGGVVHHDHLVRDARKVPPHRREAVAQDIQSVPVHDEDREVRRGAGNVGFRGTIQRGRGVQDTPGPQLEGKQHHHGLPQARVAFEVALQEAAHGAGIEDAPSPHRRGAQDVSQSLGELATKPRVEGQREAALAGVKGARWQHSRGRASQQHLPLAQRHLVMGRDPHGPLHQPVVEDRDPRLEGVEHGHAVEGAEQLVHEVGLHVDIEQPVERMASPGPGVMSLEVSHGALEVQLPAHVPGDQVLARGGVGLVQQPAGDPRVGLHGGERREAPPPPVGDETRQREQCRA